MSYNPKEKTIKEFSSKSINKKAIDKLGKKATNELTALPFFIKTDHKFSDGIEGALFIFGKIKNFKKEIKDLKGNTEMHGAAYVEYDDKQNPTLVLLPTKGKLQSKPTELKKAMKDAFTNAYANFKIGAEMTEEQLSKLEEAADNMEDEVGSSDATDTDNPILVEPTKDEKAETVKASKQTELKAKANELAAQIKDISAAFKTTIAGEIVPKIKNKTATAADKEIAENLLTKISEAQDAFAATNGVLETALGQHFTNLKAVKFQIEQVKTQIDKIIASGDGVVSATAVSDGDDLDAFLKQLDKNMSDLGKQFDKSVKTAESAPAPKIASGKDLLKSI
jgi:hypothetical protein